MRMVVVLLLFSFSVSAQDVAVKTKTIYWGDLGDEFFQKLTEPGKVLLDSVFKMAKFDSNNCIKILAQDEIKYTSRNYLSTHDYEYITIRRYGDDISIRRYTKDLVADTGRRKKVLLSYSKDIDNQIDRISLHLID